MEGAGERGRRPLVLVGLCTGFVTVGRSLTYSGLQMLLL